MKKVLISLFSLSLAHSYASASEQLLAVPTRTVVTKTHGGLFGYEYVTTTESHTTPNNVYTACADPGHNKCKVQSSAMSQPGGGDLNPSQLEEIDTLVSEKIMATRTNGQFAYTSNFLVVYTFELATSKIDYTIYTKDEANELGFNF